MTGMFAAENLTRGIFATLPPAHIDELLKRFQRVKVTRGKTSFGRAMTGTSTT